MSAKPDGIWTKVLYYCSVPAMPSPLFSQRLGKAWAPRRDTAVLQHNREREGVVVECDQAPGRCGGTSELRSVTSGSRTERSPSRCRE